MASRLRFTSLIMEGAIPEGIALLVQRQLYEVGVDMQLEAVAPRDLLPRMANGDYDAVMVQMNLGRTLARLHYFWHSSSSEPQVAFGYTATDDVLDDLRDAPTPDDMSRAASAGDRVILDGDSVNGLESKIANLVAASVYSRMLVTKSIAVVA